MTIDDKKRELALNRIKQAEESLEEAEYLLDGAKSPRSVINRAYYAMFYAVLALLIFEKFSSSKHSGVLSYFNSHFIKTGKFSKELGRAVNKAFDMRLRGDYREQVILSHEQVAPFIKLAESFINAVRNYLQESGSI
jgi:uncharacterized protein (UPF0332 family)